MYELLYRVLSTLNESTKFIVCFIAFAVLVTHPSPKTSWCILGSFVAYVNGKILKKCIGQTRPESLDGGKRRADPGMPSSHAISLAFMSCYAAAAVYRGENSLSFQAILYYLPEYLTPHFAAIAILGGVFLTWLRVALGYHTAPQVFAGYAMGAATAIGWLWAGETLVEPAFADREEMTRFLRAALAAAVGCFAFNALPPVIGALKGELARSRMSSPTNHAHVS